MRIIKLNCYNESELIQVGKKMTQLFPHCPSHGIARKRIVDRLMSASDTVKVMGIEDGNKIVGVIGYEVYQDTMSVTDFLILPSKLKKNKGVTFWLEMLESTAKINRFKYIEIKLAINDLAIVAKSKLLGYEFSQISQGAYSLSKTLSFHTGLVLAGGGARGAYQVGVWKALEELGIEFELVCGTSVGALNGGLIVQGDYEQAKKMWAEIDTGKILSYQGNQNDDNFSLQQMLKDVQKLVKSAVENQGVSTQPLKELILDLIDDEKMYNQPKELYLCTTQLPLMKEIVISLKETPKGEFSNWLLASASFFPAMEATEIGGTYYVDGGYRNNIPVDVALERGATELIVVNVKGPGVTKLHSYKESLPQITISSPWSLGTVLLFDGARSQFNIDLGYLEAKKAFGDYCGHWYTLNHELTDESVVQIYDWLVEAVSLNLSENEREVLETDQLIQGFVTKIRKFYNDRVTIETSGLFILEFVAKIAGVLPTRLYTVETLLDAVKEQLATDWQGGLGEEESMLLSLNEWVKDYIDGLPLPSEKQQVIYLNRLLKSKEKEGKLSSVITFAPKIYLAAKVINWLEMTLNEEEEKDGTRV